VWFFRNFLKFFPIFKKWIEKLLKVLSYVFLLQTFFWKSSSLEISTEFCEDSRIIILILELIFRGFFSNMRIIIRFYNCELESWEEKAGMKKRFKGKENDDSKEARSASLC
jgi:hypothetical protein